MTIEYAVIAGGCFWCTEALFRQLVGVETVESGYTGGTLPDPTYEQVCTGTTGHAEAIRIGFNPAKIRYADLLDIHFASHDPTQLNRQGNDRGTQYRSALFPYNAEQEAEARAAIGRAQSQHQHQHQQAVVTTIEPLVAWYPAETYHQDYWQGAGQRNSYCLAVIPPKLQKLRKGFADRLK